MSSLFTLTTALLGLAMSQGQSPALHPSAPFSQLRKSVSATMVELPLPTGQLSIGTKIYNWVDPSRHELASKNPLDSRQVIVQIWYPTEDHSGPTTPYVPMLSSYRRVWEDSEIDVAGR